MVNVFYLLTIFTKILHRRCLTGFQLHRYEALDISTAFDKFWYGDIIFKSRQNAISRNLLELSADFFKPCSDERQNGFKGLKLKRCKFLQPFFTSCGHDCLCLKTLKYFRFKCLRRFLKIWNWNYKSKWKSY